MSFAMKDLIDLWEIDIFPIIFSFLFSDNIVIKIVIIIQDIDNQGAEIHIFFFTIGILLLLGFLLTCLGFDENHSAWNLLSLPTFSTASESDCLIGEESKSET